MQDIRFPTIRRFNPSDMIYTDSIRIVMMQVEAMFFSEDHLQDGKSI